MRLLAIAIIPIHAALAGASLIQGRGSANACAGLIGSNGAVNLGRTTTLAAYHDGVEHYVTAFQFQGGGGEFGTLIPLPDVPSKVERGGDWTLQRLALETQPPLAEGASNDARAVGATVLQEVRIDALDITILKGGGPDVATWATEHGFRLSPDAPEVLDFYAARSPIFLAAVFDGDAALAGGQQIGDGTPVHMTIPTSNPWVPLRILALGKQPADRVDAAVFLLTDREPALLPAPRPGLALVHNEAATTTLLDDLRADAGMSWIPRSAWLTKLQVDSVAADLRFDLAVDTSGENNPSLVAAGVVLPDLAGDNTGSASTFVWAAVAASAALLVTLVVLRLQPRGDRRWPGA
jgi:hypothetical protein